MIHGGDTTDHLYGDGGNDTIRLTQAPAYILVGDAYSVGEAGGVDGGADTIRSEPAYNAEMHPVITPSGRAVLAWSAQFTSEGGSRGPVFFEAAVRSAGTQNARSWRIAGNDVRSS